MEDFTIELNLRGRNPSPCQESLGHKWKKAVYGGGCGVRMIHIKSMINSIVNLSAMIKKKVLKDKGLKNKE